MAGDAHVTTRFSFKGPGQETALFQPADLNTMLDKVDSNLNDNCNAAADHTAGTGVAVTSFHPQPVQRLRLTLTAASITVTNALKYGSLKILTWKNTNIVVLNARQNLTVTKDGVGILSADTPNIGVGSAAASNTTLATTMIDTVNKVAMAGASLAEAAQKNGAATPDIRYIAAGATNYLYLNAGATGNSGTADGSLLVSGTIDIDYVDLGLFS